LGGTQARLEEAPAIRGLAPLKLTKAMPVLYVSDVQAAPVSIVKLGFTIDFLHSRPAFYACRRDEACIHLRFVHQPMYVAGSRERSR
jgi:hypothetical protein